jgi:hypothetical protein
MMTVGRCGKRYLLRSAGFTRHMSQKELVGIVKTGMRALAAKRKAPICDNCKWVGHG